jgi:hypothetical protein
VSTRRTPAPPPIRPATEQIDESWDDLVVGALGEDAAPSAEDPDVFERETTIPTSPPAGSGLEVDFDSHPPRAFPGSIGSPRAPVQFGSEPPDSGRPAWIPGGATPQPAPPGKADATPTVTPVRAARKGDGPGPGRLPLPGQRAQGGREYERKHTMPEPVVERYIARVEAGTPSPADSLDERHRADDADDADQASPLDLVETYRRTTESLPGQLAIDPDDKPRGGRESGTMQDMQDRYAVGDFTGALVVAESILDANPDHEDAKRYAQSCREVLTQMYAARIGPMDQIAVVAVPPDQITWLSLDHRAGFLLSLVDGVSSIEEILDISGMTRLDALRIMYTLVQQNVLTLSH